MLNKTKHTDQTLPLEEGKYYHIFNRGNNKVNLFYNEGNYLHFLKKYNYYLSDYVDTYAYCLIPNHFHLLIRVKPLEEFPILIDGEQYTDSLIGYRDTLEDQVRKIISEKFRVFFMTYTKGVNKQTGREGSLFRSKFRRKLIDSPKYLMRLVGYIHANPIKHGLVNSLLDYPHSSYKTLISENKTRLKRGEVFDWFGGKDEFLNSHQALESFLREDF